ncbi:MAG: response regulator [Sandaracinaceae bacterium]|nr:response regulator [Sandaracinaceae bacterium]
MKLKVMVIDDSELVLSVVRSFLSSVGHDVVTRSMAVGTRAAVLREQPDVVLLDVNMPLLDGAEVCASIRAHEGIRETRVLLHSDRPEPELRELARASRADGYLCKTGDRERFLRRFEELTGLASRRAGARVSYVLAACGGLVAARLRAELVSPLRIEYTDSGAEVLRRVFSTDAPSGLLLGTSLRDVPWETVRAQTAQRDPRLGAQLVLLREDPVVAVPPGVTVWDAGHGIEALEAMLERAHTSR